MSTFSFSFNLDVADDEQVGNPSDKHAYNEATEVTPPSSEFVAISCFEVPCPHIETTDEMSLDFIPHNIGDFVFKEALRPLLDNQFDGESDLIPGKYEGGFKIWECSYDLAEIVANYTGIIPHNPKKILELGCGHGVPAIMSMLVFENLTEIVFSDFNSEVLEYTTWPNIIINCSSACENVRCIAGDWATLSPLIENFDLILSTETLYTVESCRKVFDMVTAHLDTEGVALIASKKYYFGVGGGTFELENLAAMPSSKLKYCLVKSYEDGQSNIREVIKLVRK